MGLIWDILNVADKMKEDNKKKEEKELEKLYDYYGLEEHERELVKKGEYDPWDFEEDNLTEDDYYYNGKK